MSECLWSGVLVYFLFLPVTSSQLINETFIYNLLIIDFIHHVCGVATTSHSHQY